MSYSAKEFDSHYMITDPQGNEFPMAKDAVPAEAMPKLQSMLSSQMPSAPAPAAAQPAAPAQNPFADQISQNRDYLQKLNPGIYTSAPQLLDRDAQDMALNRAQKDFNIKNADEMSKQQDAAKIFARDQAYNEQAQKLGLPLRQVQAPAAIGQPQMTPASMSADGSMAQQPGQSGLNPQAGALGQYGEMFKQYEQGIKDYTRDAQGAAGMMGQAYKDQIIQARTTDELHANNLKTIQDENHKLTDDYMTGKVDPNRVWSNMNTGNKVTAAIAIALSGIGSGLTGKSNAAMDVINGAIDRDIESQKANLGKTQNLLQMNLQKYRNEQDAYAATKSQMIAATQAKIGLASASMQGSQAKMAAQQSLMALQSQKVQLEMMMAQNMTKAQLAGLGSGQGGIPTKDLPFSVLNDEKTMGKSVDINGTTYLARSEDEAKQLRTQNTKADSVMSQIGALDKLGTSALIPGTSANNQAQTILNRLATEIPQLNGIGRLNETEIHQAMQLFKDPTSLRQAMSGGIKNHQFIKTLIDEVESDRANKLVGYKPLKTVE
jgi:hypothetical protein